MAPKSLLENNPHLRNKQEYQRALRASVHSSIAIEGVRKAAEDAQAKIESIKASAVLLGVQEPNVKLTGWRGFIAPVRVEWRVGRLVRR
ncbi:MAG: hypothetical protein Q7J38_07195 [Gallionella sp.]|nr:hypothetical protein [Gallionella sp.]